MLVFLKLGGSLITDKSKPYTPRLDAIQRLAEEIATARHKNPALRLLLGHGSGSFGHTSAKKYNTHLGVKSPEEWCGFSEVWHEARALNQIVIEACASAGLPVIAFPPSACAVTDNQRISAWDIQPIAEALTHGLIPVINGDSVFDQHKGGTILSTEESFVYLARYLQPDRILFAGHESGVWDDFPDCTRLIALITPETYAAKAASVGASAWTDVTGGMAQKVTAMLELCRTLPHLSAYIFSGLTPGSVFSALSGTPPGTRISASLDSQEIK